MKFLITILILLPGRAPCLEAARDPGGAADQTNANPGAGSEVLDSRAVLGAILSIPGLDRAKVQILDVSRTPVRGGHLRFSLASLPTPPGRDCRNPVLWRGVLVYDTSRTTPIWTKAIVCVVQPVVRTTILIPYSVEITAEMLEAATVTTCPNGVTPRPRSIEEVVGRKAARRIQCGEVLESSSIRNPDVIVRGQLVQVTVASGRVRLRIEGEAVSSACLGEMVTIRNAKTGSTFKARADGRASAQIALGDESGL